MKGGEKYQPNIFADFFENEAIVNIQKFARIAQVERLTVELGFSGGKDSIVCYSLCKRAEIPFIAVFNYAFESPEVVSFIRENYPDVIIRKKEKSYFQLIKARKLLPSNNMRFCCQYFKENSKNAVITGVRREESETRKKRKLFGARKIKTLKKYAKMNVFQENCTEKAKNSPIVLRPIICFSEVEVWSYIRKYNLPYPSLYDEGQRRCGCMLCPLATLKSNMYYLKKYPNLLPSFNRNVAQKLPIDFIFNRGGDNETEMKNDSYRYLLYWLSASFRPSEREKKLVDNYLKENRL
jgi:phosphoadenosine phosphosulfate reductase